MSDQSVKTRLPTKRQIETARVASAAADWLRLHDKRLWGEKKKLKQAREEFTEKIGVKRFKEIAVANCKWFLNEEKRGGSSTSTESLSAEQWEGIQDACRKNAEVLNEPDSTLAFCVRYLCWSGVAVNAKLLVNCMVFHRVTGGRFRGK